MAEQPMLSGPHLQVAGFCEKVLIESDQVVSLIRLVDRFTVNGPTPEMTPAILDMYLVIAFKSGFVREKHTVRVVPNTPSGRELAAHEWPTLFEGDDRGNMIVSRLKFLAEEEGLYWFDVSCGGILVTRIPLRVIYQRVAYATPGQSR